MNPRRSSGKSRATAAASDLSATLDSKDSDLPVESVEVIRWNSWLCLIAGWIVPQIFLIGPALIGSSMLVPVDLLSLPSVYTAQSGDVPRFRPQNSVLMDLILVDAPARDFCVREFQAGRLPLWQPDNYLGAPFTSWPKYSPFELPYWIAPYPVTLAWIRLLQVICLGSGTWVFLRRSAGLSFWPAALGSWCMPLIGFLAVWQGYPVTGGIAWLPWLLSAVHSTVRTHSGRSAIAVAASSGLLLLSGQPDVGALCLLASGFYAVSRIFAEHRLNWRACLSSSALLAITWGLGFLLAAPYWLPLIDYARSGIRLQARISGVEERPPIGSEALAMFLCPEGMGNTRKDSVCIASTGNLLESSAGAYAGLFAFLFLSPLAWCDVSRRSQVMFWTGLAVFGVAWQFNIPGFVQVMRLPWINSLSYNRAVFLAAMGIIVLGAIGLEQFGAQVVRTRRWFQIPIGTCIVLCMTFLASAADLPEPVRSQIAAGIQGGYEKTLTLKDVEQIQATYIRTYLVSAIFAASAAACWFWIYCGCPQRNAAAVLFGILMVCDPLRFALRESETRQFPTQTVFPRVNALERLSALPSGRIWGIRCLPPNLNRTHGLQDIRGYDAVDPEMLVRVLNVVIDPQYRSPEFAQTQSMVPAFFDTPNGPQLHPILSALNIRYLVTRMPLPIPLPQVIQNDDYWVFENTRAQPRAWIPESVQSMPDHDSVLQKMRGFDFDAGKVAFVTDQTSFPGICRGNVSLKQNNPLDLELQASLETDGLVVVADLWDPDWEVTVDEQPAELVRTNFLLRGVRVSAGEHRIQMRYVPESVRTGFVLSLRAAIFLFLWLVTLMFRQRFPSRLSRPQR